MNKFLLTGITIFSFASFAKEKPLLRQPASAAQRSVVCYVGDGKEASKPKLITATLKKTSEPSIDQEIGDYRIMAYWIPQANKLTIGVTEKVSSTTASTLVGENSQVGNLFASKNGQSIDLNCYIQ